jgi:hypothetical protein
LNPPENVTDNSQEEWKYSKNDELDKVGLEEAIFRFGESSFFCHKAIN